MEKRVFISATENKSLDERRRLLKAAVLAKIREAGYAPQEFSESGIPENLGWTFENLDRVMRKCVGAVVFGFPRWPVSEVSGRQLRERWGLHGQSNTTTYNHFEGAVAVTHGLPVLLLSEQGVNRTGVFYGGGGKAITFVPEEADESWLKSDEFTKRFKAWLRELDARKDVFLGY